MKTYRCIDDITTADDHPCGCWYRETTPGQWEYRYAGDQQPWARLDRHWRPIRDTSITGIESYGHTLEEVPQ